MSLPVSFWKKSHFWFEQVAAVPVRGLTITRRVSFNSVKRLYALIKDNRTDFVLEQINPTIKKNDHRSSNRILGHLM